MILEEIEHPTWLGRKYHGFAKFCMRLKGTDTSLGRKYDVFMAVMLVVVGLFAGMSADETMSNQTTFAVVNDHFNSFALAIFWIELGVNLGAMGFQPLKFFFKRLDWTKPRPGALFDLFVCVASTVSGGRLVLLKILRLLLLFRLLPLFPTMGVPVAALADGMVSLSIIGLITFFLIFNYALVGVILFKKNDPFHFMHLHRAMISLFRCATLEDWTEIM